MDLETYHCSVNPATGLFEFYSEGPKGRIKKVVNYQELQSGISGMPAYNLCFGDWDEDTGDIRDRRVTNNRDMGKILATVASTVVSFTDVRGPCMIYGEGSTASRTRLYQMCINANWEQVSRLFFVSGQFRDKWEPFRQGRNYDALLVMKRLALAAAS
ncbi:DUF6934 family protein [Chitinophaga rhizophila]|uniref:Uncharacterized protein n=1 Tax=Chitinophaga rhizophila TaxID=2866212 RepID=A0ABS7GCH4_9BACT|nr:hypothetical protein [Chitinophaga rhizophila]MBW8685036.1 hypothetical protein [Chitinophaga rhizophila]